MAEKKKGEVKRVWDNTKIILKKIGEAGSKMGESMEKSIKDLERNGDLKGEKEFNINNLLAKLPQQLKKTKFFYLRPLKLLFIVLLIIYVLCNTIHYTLYIPKK